MQRAVVGLLPFLGLLACPFGLLGKGPEREAVADPRTVLARTTADLLGWLPPDTETLAVARGPFRCPAKTDDSKVEEPQLAALLEWNAIRPLGIRDYAFLKFLSGRTVLLAVEGSRNCRLPSGMMMPYDGCHILVFQDPLPDRGAALTKALAAHSARSTEHAGHRVFVIRERMKQDAETVCFTLPRPDVLLVATDEKFLREVLERRGRAQALFQGRSVCRLGEVRPHGPVLGRPTPARRLPGKPKPG